MKGHDYPSCADFRREGVQDNERPLAKQWLGWIKIV